MKGTKKVPDWSPKYHPKHTPETAAKLMRLGTTEKELADIMGLDPTTLFEWKKEYPEFLAAMNSARDEADRRVEESLYHRALGFQKRTQKPLMDKAGNVKVVDLIETVPPDTIACIFWLKNRQRDRWRDVNRQEVVHSWENMTADELRAEIQRVSGELNADDAKALGFRVEVKAEPAGRRSN